MLNSVKWEQTLNTPSHMAQVCRRGGSSGQWRPRAALHRWPDDKPMLTFDFVGDQMITDHLWHRSAGSLKGPCSLYESYSAWGTGWKIKRDSQMSHRVGKCPFPFADHLCLWRIETSIFLIHDDFWLKHTHSRLGNSWGWSWLSLFSTYSLWHVFNCIHNWFTLNLHFESWHFAVFFIRTASSSLGWKHVIAVS